MCDVCAVTCASLTVPARLHRQFLERPGCTCATAQAPAANMPRDPVAIMIFTTRSRASGSIPARGYRHVQCPHCQSSNLNVVDSRAADNATRRRRHCQDCDRRFTTYERVDQFHCPNCGSTASRIISQALSAGFTERRRECRNCRGRFYTRETSTINPVVVVKRDHRRESFDRGKILASVRVATAKLPVATSRIEALVDDVMAEIANRGLLEIPSLDIGRMVMTRLHGISEMAYVRFASVYESLTNLDDLSFQISHARGGGVNRNDPRQFQLFPESDEPDK